jgi:hypothetical protein
MVVSSDFSAIKEEAFAIEYEIHSPGARVIVSISNEIQSKLTVGRRKGALRWGLREVILPEWSYRAHILFDEPRASYHITADPHAALWSRDDSVGDSRPIVVESPFDPSFLSKSLWNIRLQLIEETNEYSHDALLSDLFGSCWGRFDETLGAFDAITGAAEAVHTSHGLEPSSLVVVVHSEYGDFPMPTRIPEGIVKIVERSRGFPGAESISINQKSISFLKTINDLFGFSGSDIVFRRDAKTVTGEDTEELSYSKISFLFTLDNGSVITHEKLSYGQKRLLSFLYYLAVSEDIVIADELVNGLHYDWIEVCLKEIGSRQAFLTSQNPLLLDFLPFESAEEVRRSFLLCRREKHEGKSRMVWSNMDQENAEAFFRSYKTKALQVSEILRTRGLW